MKIVYLHGFASGPQSSKAQFFRRRFQEIGVDMEIPDLSEGDFEGLTIGGQLRVIERAVGSREACLLGSSMGGYLAALYAARHIEVRRLFLMAPAFGFARRWRAMLGEEKVAEWRRTGWLPVFHYGEKREMRVGYRLLEEAEQYEDYPAAPQAAVVFHGRGDDVVPAGYSEEYTRRNPQTKLRVVESGHDLLNVLEDMWTAARELVEDGKRENGSRTASD